MDEHKGVIDMAFLFLLNMLEHRISLVNYTKQRFLKYVFYLIDYHHNMANSLEDRNDPFADLEYHPTNPKLTQDVANRNSGINTLSKQPPSKAGQLKAENYDLWFQNERLNEENGALGTEFGKLHDKHDKLMYLARNRLGEVRSKYQRLEQDNQTLKTELDRLAREYETTRKLVEDYRRMEER
jgi:hypothetical protein